MDGPKDNKQSAAFNDPFLSAGANAYNEPLALAEDDGCVPSHAVSH